jgi:hypothetical protein
MIIRLHFSTYVDKGDGTFSMNVTYVRPLNPGDAPTAQVRTTCRPKPAPAPTADDMLALYRGMFPNATVELAA